MSDRVSCEDPNLLVEACPSRKALDLIASKWAVLTLYAVGTGISRHGDMRRQMQGVTQKRLTRTLGELERSGLVHRAVLAQSPPSVEYTLTDLGHSLLVIVQELCNWAVVHMEQVQSAQAAFDTSV